MKRRLVRRGYDNAHRAFLIATLALFASCGGDDETVRRRPAAGGDQMRGDQQQRVPRRQA